MTQDDEDRARITVMCFLACIVIVLVGIGAAM